MRVWRTYNAFGAVTKTEAELVGTLPLDRFHETPGAAIAPPPSGAASDGVFETRSTSYDAFGNMTHTQAPDGGCRDLEYDATYGALLVNDTTYVGTVVAGCGDEAMSTSAEYDRGLGALTVITGIRGEKAKVDYDGFGRVVAKWRPDPVDPSTLQALPVQRFEYLLPGASGDPALSFVRTREQDGSTPNEASYREHWAYLDGFGRTRLALDQADPAAGDGGQWVGSGKAEYDAKGAVERSYRAWFWDGDPMAFPLRTFVVPTASVRERHDAFGRVVQTWGLEGQETGKTDYRALESVFWDAEDLKQAVQTTTTTRVDGHGRHVATIERVRENAVLEDRETLIAYLPTGEVERITRRRGADEVVRWFRYDSLGRMVLNVEPSTAQGFTADPNADPSTFKAWRYAYNQRGQLVGTSDARGCGINYHYDAAGRLLMEDYSPCLATQHTYSAPVQAAGTGIEVLYRYNHPDPETGSIVSPTGQTFPANPALLRGRIASISDRASKTVMRYDGLGRTSGVARKVAKPGPPDPSFAARYAPRWYLQDADFDAANRPTRASTGGTVALLAGDDGKSEVHTAYTKRGHVKTIGGSYGPLLTASTSNADGQPLSLTLGDIAGTTRAFTYDPRARLASVQTYRGPPALWSGPSGSYLPPSPADPPVLQLLLEDTDVLYDEVDNPLDLIDWRVAAEWPAGAKPVSRHVTYDDLYRVKQVDYDYPGADDAWVSPFARENEDLPADAGRAKPSPHVAFAKRVLQETFAYDWLGNTVGSDDDAHGFYDQSLGDVTNAGYQLVHASNRTGPPAPGSHEGDLDATYDTAGNLASLVVRRDGVCLPVGASCWQWFAYDWDEVGRLARARRWDLTLLEQAAGDQPTRAPDADLRYAYDAGDERVLKTSVKPASAEAHTVYVFGSLELRRTSWEGTDFRLDEETETIFLSTGAGAARVLHAEEDPTTSTSGHRHVFFEIGDTLGSSAIIIDKETSELVERATYTAYGAPESDYRTDRWSGFREDYRFTGKEDDVEVGLAYFGKRYLSAAMGRWASPDPADVHELRGDLNAYSYVEGRAFATVDPDGRCAVACAAIAIGIAAVAGFAMSAVSQAADNNWNWSKVDLAQAGIAGGAMALGAGVTIATFGAAAPSAGAFVGADLATKAVAAAPAMFVSSSLGGMTAYTAQNLALSRGQTPGTAEDVARVGLVSGGLGVLTLGLGAAVGIDPLPAPTAKPPAAEPDPKIPWGQGNKHQGLAAEKAMLGEMGAEGFSDPYFPTIDGRIGGAVEPDVIVSAKSVNTGGPSYLRNPSKISQTVQKYADQLADVAPGQVLESKRTGELVIVGPRTQKVLGVALPRSTDPAIIRTLEEQGVRMNAEQGIQLRLFEWH